MLSLLLLAPPLGVVLGYIMTAIVTRWQWSFYVQAFLSVVPIALVLSLIKNKYLDVETAVERKFEETHDMV
jgi:MFS family permease